MVSIGVWPSDLTGCGHYRQIYPATTLIADGHDEIVVETEGPTVMWDRRWDGPSPPLEYEVIEVMRPDYDVVVIGRPARRQWLGIIEGLQAQGVKVVVDVDDDFSCIPRMSVVAHMFDPILQPHHNYEVTAEACRLADWVTVTTPALAARYGSHGRVTVLPNMVPAWYLDITPEPNENLTVGWTGTIGTHPHDLETTGGGVHRALMTAPGSVFAVVGDGKFVDAALGTTVSKVTGWLPFDEYPIAMSSLDIGIVPLHDAPFNRAKSALKMCEFAALGVPVVVSPTPDNARMRQAGVGVLADSPSQWKKQLQRLLGSADMRTEMAATGREVMAAYTYQRTAEAWLDVWTSVAAKVAA